MSYYPNQRHPHATSRGAPVYPVHHSSSRSRPAINPANRRRLPQAAYTPPSYRVLHGKPQKLHAPVSFDYPGRVQEGVSMRELRTQGTMTQIQGANDPVLAHIKLDRLVFRILWPSYPEYEWCRAVPLVASNGAPITRVALGMQIASNFAHFCEKAQYETPTSADWMVSPTCVKFEHLVLVSLQNTAEGVWQADVILDFA
ncbi:hypothetical protein C8R43DRAFT_1135745 [Mycena crocata]|nr:hypothetical protein C8R43DRAFT_1135745 [Mycena crocata]